ncbi:hypothetical protein RND71_030217 [Anisodus tanguticus]|uniref:RRM domain-containing protein n=1 Tax=Anisodus tanguticus TaxID=243964 RepID=A0AAE1V742_9SOLA|nr:hypothetical protein RND71_030217 [Anisodus tanguticus]
MDSTQKSYEYLDMSENNGNDNFPSLVLKLQRTDPEEEKSVTITQEPPKFSYATMLAKKTITSPSAILPKKVVRVAPSDSESRPHTGPIIVAGPKEKVICVRGLPKKLNAVDLIQELKKFGPIKLDSLQIKRPNFGSCSGILEFQSYDSTRAAVEAGKIKFGEHFGFVSFRSAPPRYGSSMNWNQGR